MRKQKEIIFIFKVYVCINNHNEAANDVINILASKDMDKDNDIIIHQIFSLTRDWSKHIT